MHACLLWRVDWGSDNSHCDYVSEQMLLHIHCVALQCLRIRCPLVQWYIRLLIPFSRDISQFLLWHLLSLHISSKSRLGLNALGSTHNSWYHHTICTTVSVQSQTSELATQSFNNAENVFESQSNQCVPIRSTRQSIQMLNINVKNAALVLVVMTFQCQ